MATNVVESCRLMASYWKDFNEARRRASAENGDAQTTGAPDAYSAGYRYIKPVGLLNKQPFITSAAMPDSHSEADYHGPKDTSDPLYPAHKAIHDAAEHLLNGRVTNASARRGLRDALDKADSRADGTSRTRGDNAIGRVIRG